MQIKILLLCKKTLFCEYAIKILQSYFSSEEIIIVRGDINTDINEDVYFYNPDYLISFLSPWILSPALLKTANKAAINFHPGSPRYPGNCCYSFAIYEQSVKYGVTCHHMKEKVDTGDIIMTSYFDIAPRESVESLKLKAMNHLLFIFEKIINQIYTCDSLPISEEKWLRIPYTKKQMQKLCQIASYTNNQIDINLAIRALNYSPEYDGAYIEINGEKFYSRSFIDKPIV